MSWMPDAVGAALIAGGVSLAGLLITNQSKVSEFRQSWINALRDDVATLITHALEIHSATTITDGNPSFAKVQEATARIQLRLNPKEDESIVLISAMGGLRQAIHSNTTFEQVNAEVVKLTEATQAILKKEWRRVKTGEPFYKWTRRLLVATLAVLAAVTIYERHEWLWQLLK